MTRSLAWGAVAVLGYHTAIGLAGTQHNPATPSLHQKGFWERGSLEKLLQKVGKHRCSHKIDKTFVLPRETLPTSAGPTALGPPAVLVRGARRQAGSSPAETKPETLSWLRIDI